MEVPTKGLSSCSCSQNKHTSSSNSMMEIWIHQGLDGIDICVIPDILSIYSTFYQCIDDLWWFGEIAFIWDLMVGIWEKILFKWNSQGCSFPLFLFVHLCQVRRCCTWGSKVFKVISLFCLKQEGVDEGT